jgi:type I restriction enzyme S subunit
MGNEHWVEVPFKDVITTLESGSRPKGGVKGISEGIPSIGAEHLDSDGGFNFSNVRYIPESFAKNMKRGVINQGDILIVKDGATTGKVSLVTKDFPFKLCCINEHMFICRLHKNILNEYSFYFLRNQTGQEQIMDGFHGGAQGGINSSFVDNIYFPLPPFNEQKRIVEKLDAVLPKVRQSKERLEKISIILKKFRQSVLAAACSGRLTAKWREGKDLPEWEKINVGNVITALNYGTSKKCDYSVKDGIPVLRIPNVSSGKLTLDDLKYTTLDKKERVHYSLESGDLLMIRSNGSVSLLGLTVVADDTVVGYAYAGYLICLKCNKQLVVPNFLYLVLNSNELRTQIELPARSTTGVHNINSKEIKSLLIPRPPLPEQQEIVNRVKTLFALSDSLEEKYQSAISRVNKIEQAILAKAFRGELAEADPDDEPAEELLKRILRVKEAK